MRFRLVLAILAFCVPPAFAKSLHWRTVDVSARLDRDGALHIIERQAMVFDGDWNGGERTFRLAPEQQFKFVSLTRVEDGVEHAVIPGDLTEVDQRNFPSPTVLRWRSRLPVDPPFENKEITYVLTYSYANVVTETDGVYSLNHDFAFSRRPGPIEHFSLRLELDPAWSGASSPVTAERQNLIPGQSVIVPLKLAFTGEVKPASVIHTPSRRLAIAILAVFFIVLALLILNFAMTEQKKGRFASLAPPETIDEAWLRQHVFVWSPEAAGTALDGKTEAAEVAAVLARMTLEGKISSTVTTRNGHQVLHLKLLVDRTTLPEAEQPLVQALFSFETETDTDSIRKSYEKIGFNPGSIVAEGLKKPLRRFNSWERPRQHGVRDGILVILAAVALALVAILLEGNNTRAGLLILGVGAACCFFGAFVADVNSRAITRLPARFALVGALLVPVVALATRYSLLTVTLWLNAMVITAMCAWAAVVIKVVLDALRTPETAERIAVRKRLYAARRFFVTELRSGSPHLRDDWYPYFLAFGLGQNIERWFGLFGTPSTGSSEFARSRSSSMSTSTESSPSASPSFTGGGGAFGGAGASGGWGLAATAMVSGFSAPQKYAGGASSSGSSSSSSSSSGGGSSSSSSSGGGGGGGW